jgi:GNAT superfamily N-acetyltransferase
MSVRPLEDTDRTWLRDLIVREWGLPVVSVSGTYDPSTLQGFVADGSTRRLGALTYRLTANECEVITLNSLVERNGVGSALLTAAKALADREACRLWLITTNDNINAIRFYQRRGMDMKALHRRFVEEVRRRKPLLDDHAHGGIPFRPAIEFSY